MTRRRPRGAHRNAVSLLTASTLALLCGPAFAQQPTLTGSIQWLPTAPVDVLRNNGVLESDTITYAFQEQDDLQLSQDMEVDFRNLGVYGGPNSASNPSVEDWHGHGAIASGTVVDVYLFHFDRASSAGKVCSQGTITFPGDILGVQVRRKSLLGNATEGTGYFGGDAVLGHPATLYPASNSQSIHRGLENGQRTTINGAAHWETVALLDARTIDLSLVVNDFPDHVRVITSASGNAPISSYCFGDSGCPCNNDSDPQTFAGCRNSRGMGAKLVATASGAVTADNLGLRLSGLPRDLFGVVFVGGVDPNPAPFGDGIRCVTPGPPGNGAGGGFTRLPLTFSGPVGVIEYSNLPAHLGQGFLTPGTWAFQGYYRDPANLGCSQSGFNLSNAVSVTLP